MLDHQKVINVGKLPENYESMRDIDQLDEFHIEELEQLGIITAIYWYATGDYDGDGYLLYQTSQGWGLHDMGHCSCYGPLDDLRDHHASTQALESLWNSCSDHLKTQTAALFAIARQME